MKIFLFSLFFCLALSARPGLSGEAESLEPSPPASAPSPSPAPGVSGLELSGGFILYYPNQEGDYEWKMEGDKVVFLTPACQEITRLTATALLPSLEGLTLEAETMSYFKDSGIARSEQSRIVVRRKNTVLTGKGYLWTPANQQLRVFEDVRLLIQETAEGGMFPR